MVKASFAWLDASHETDWIRVATMMAGNDRGSFFMPEVNDEVLLAFEQGDPRFAYVVGFLWNDKDKPPAQHVRERVFKSKNGHTIRFLDSTPKGGDKGAVIIEDAHQNRVVLRNSLVLIESRGHVVIDGASITFKVAGKAVRVLRSDGNPV
jgi:uncharacterized protein involved in type VI secretion and phage assembly